MSAKQRMESFAQLFIRYGLDNNYLIDSGSLRFIAGLNPN